MHQNLHQQLQHVSEQIKKADATVRQAQGTDSALLEQAYQQLQKVEKDLQDARSQAGSEATENPQFQQAFEQLHNTRQHMQEIKQNQNGLH